MAKSTLSTMRGCIFKDTFDGKIDFIIHQVNCFHDMHSSFANGIRKCFESAYIADQATPFGDKKKLGKYSYGKTYLRKINHEVVVVNMYSQFSNKVEIDIKGNKIPPSNLLYLEEALTRIFSRIRKYHPTARVALPKIGNAYSGDSWKEIKAIISRCSQGVKTSVYTKPLESA